jgi:hypothetical protein
VCMCVCVCVCVCLCVAVVQDQDTRAPRAIVTYDLTRYSVHVKCTDRVLLQVLCVPPWQI